jgi:3-phenylpropionate/trans-cinnamate dioxygenase ferredoxin reductase subunit
MAESSTFVIVGGGLAGAKAAETLREKGFGGDIVLMADEAHLPYERPPCAALRSPGRVAG